MGKIAHLEVLVVHLFQKAGIATDLLVTVVNLAHRCFSTTSPIISLPPIHMLKLATDAPLGTGNSIQGFDLSILGVSERPRSTSVTAMPLLMVTRGVLVNFEDAARSVVGDEQARRPRLGSDGEHQARGQHQGCHSH